MTMNLVFEKCFVGHMSMQVSETRRANSEGPSTASMTGPNLEIKLAPQ